MRSKFAISILLCLCLILPLCFIPISAEDISTPEGDYTFIGGVYQFNDILTSDITLGSYSISFTSNGESYNLITFQAAGGIRVLYGNTSTGTSLTVYSTSSFNDSNWRSDAYRTIDLGLSLQGVDPLLASWIESNASLITSPDIPQPDPIEYFLRSGWYAKRLTPILPDLSRTTGEMFSASPGSYFVDSSYNERSFYSFGYDVLYYNSPNDFDVRFMIQETSDSSSLRAWFGVTSLNGLVSVIDYPDEDGNRFLRLYNSSNVEMDELSYSLIVQLLSPSSQPPEQYEGNPWIDIFNMIIQALQVNLFGYFSIWDIFSTLCGMFLVIWLLKVIAGG